MTYPPSFPTVSISFFVCAFTWAASLIEEVKPACRLRGTYFPDNGFRPEKVGAVDTSRIPCLLAVAAGTPAALVPEALEKKAWGSGLR